MGQYHYIVNFTKKQYLHPHDFGDGLKLHEFTTGLSMQALAFLLAQSAGRGGGDFLPDDEWCGSWSGDKVGIVGDYDDSNLHSLIHEDEENEKLIMNQIANATDNTKFWKNVSGPVFAAMMHDNVLKEAFLTINPEVNEQRVIDYVHERKETLWKAAMPNTPFPGLLRE